MTSSERISQYRVMWVMVFFDLPTDTKKEVKAATEFRKQLMSDGFVMFQYSIYLRSTKQRITCTKQQFDDYYREIDNFRRKQQRHGRCICLPSKQLMCDMDC